LSRRTAAWNRTARMQDRVGWHRFVLRIFRVSTDQEIDDLAR
jgi:hypothetical protein